MSIEVVGFNELKTLYPKDPNFAKAWKDHKEPITLDRTRRIDYMIQDDMLFKGSQICIIRSSMRENLIKEKHSGGMVRHFIRDKTIDIISKHYFWPLLSQDVKKFVQTSRVC